MSLWKDALRTVAPLLGGALGGGPLGAMAMRAVTNKLLGPAETSTGKELEKKLEAVIQLDPNALIKLKEVEYEFKTKLKELDIDEKKVHAGDRSNARSMAINTSLMPQMILATIYVLAFAAILIAIFTGDVKLEGTQKDLAILLIGILSTGLVQIMNFFFGSSSGSKEKDTPKI